MTPSEIHTFIDGRRWAVEATVNSTGGPQAAVIGFIVSSQLELFFDTLRSSRKYRNILDNPRVAFVIGWDDGCTVQYEGIADEPTGPELERLKSKYFERFPDGRDRASQEDLTYVRVKPVWIRFSDFRASSPRIVELSGSAI